MNKLPMMIAMLAGCSMLAGVLPQAWSDPGDIIITRTVEPRTAFRPGSGPVSSKVSPSAQVQSALGLNQYPGGNVAHELSSSDVAKVVTGVPMSTGNFATPNAGLAGALANNGLGGNYGGTTVGRVMAGTLGGGGAGAGGAVGNIGNTVQQATGQFIGALTGAGLIGR